MERILFWGGGWEGEVGAERDLGPGGRAEGGGQREFNFSGTEAKEGRSRFCQLLCMRRHFVCYGVRTRLLVYNHYQGRFTKIRYYGLIFTHTKVHRQVPYS